MTVLAIDPGNEQSAWVLYNGSRPVAFAKESNAEVLHKMRRLSDNSGPFARTEHIAIEMVASYGMPVGREVFETVLWSGRFTEAAWTVDHTLVYRRDVKLHLCGQARAKDGNVRQALIDRWGGKAKAIGSKVKPGPLYGFKADTWQALAVAVTWSDRQTQSSVYSKPIASGEVSQ